MFVEFEWDPAKSALSETKHGIGFAESRALWEDPGLIILPSRFPDEPRHLAIGMIRGKHYTAIFTEREGGIRIISVRRSRDNERNLYEDNQP